MSSLADPAAEPLTLSQVLRDLGPLQFVNGLIGFIFAATGPVAIVLSVATKAHLSDAQIASWIFACFFINGALTLFMTWRYRQPLCFFWTIPGTVLAGQGLAHLSFAQVVGCYYATSLLILIVGATGLAKRALEWIPMPIVMGMVAGVFLRFGLDIVRALSGYPLLGWAMLVAFLALSANERIARLMPPILGALIVGAIVLIVSPRGAGEALTGLALAKPVIASAAFSWQAMIELVVPLAITVLVVQNAQGFAILQAAGHKPPANAVTIACGIGGVFSAAVGGVGTCLTGPTNGIVTSSGERHRHYAAALSTGGLAIVFGLFSPTFTRLMLSTPKEFIMMLGGLAMLRVLQGAFVSSFKGPYAFGALASLLVTIADIPLFGIGAAFWGLVAGAIVSRILEREHYAKG
ncbi:MAG TPA: benzoate/H(+) symporter BenE family transporter [Beijerinckiaceae bacterium]|nr:benzoate/H(+) symporter BenE family transporter [Rhodoblastus sp.]MCC0000061.1 benzoate/H(+) symporter BenE family transporter [Methylobacteriaceae bacterium]HRY04471.1 benzoate/H(+) symporter BenE family transporter [Beijerinckiaceae bacterium]